MSYNRKIPETFWEIMRRSAESARLAPEWMQAGINLNEKNYETFRSESK